MSYTKQNFQKGNILYADQLNAMDEQISRNASALSDGNLLTTDHNTDSSAHADIQKEIADCIKKTDLGSAIDTALTAAKPEIIQAILAELGASIIGYIDGNIITFRGNLAEGTYAAYWVVNGELVNIGELTRSEGGETPKYTITWVVDGETTTESYEAGETPSFKGSTDKKSDGQYDYTFIGWDPAITTVDGDKTYTAQYSQTAIEPDVTKYSITWKNEDGTVLKTDTVAAGTTPEYNGTTPTKAPDTRTDYVFKEWSPTIVTATSDAIYTATYTPTNLLVTAGYTKGCKISVSSGSESTSSNACVSGYIPITTPAHNFLIKNITVSPAESINNIVFYDADKNKLSGAAGVAGAFTQNIYVESDENGKVMYTFRPNRWSQTENAKYFRFSCGDITDESIVKENEPQ